MPKKASLLLLLRLPHGLFWQVVVVGVVAEITRFI
jgi:hypothetical protein